MNEQFIQHLSIAWDKIEQSSYLRKIEAINNLEELVFEKPITIFVGENGSGKSTLLEALAVAQNQLRPNGLYLFDEPEAALSPQRQLTLLMEIFSCAKQGSQFIIVTHSPILLGIPDAQILSFDDGTVHNCEYEDTDSYKITEMFINNREVLLGRLLSE